jgi:hypothetical protein
MIPDEATDTTTGFPLESARVVTAPTVAGVPFGRTTPAEKPGTALMVLLPITAMTLGDGGACGSGTGVLVSIFVCSGAGAGAGALGVVGAG